MRRPKSLREYYLPTERLFRQKSSEAMAHKMATASATY